MQIISSTCFCGLEELRVTSTCYFYSIKHISGDLESLKPVVWHSGQNSSNSKLTD